RNPVERHCLSDQQVLATCGGNGTENCGRTVGGTAATPTKKAAIAGENVMKLMSKAAAAALMLTAAIMTAPTQAQTQTPASARIGVERLYIIDCGRSVGPDKSRWTPGVDVGKPLDMVGNCYLIRHAQGLLLWDTGVTDEIAKLPDGRPGQGGSPHWW